MNLYRLAWKVAKHFGTTPKFLYYDYDNSKGYYLGDIRRDWLHYHLIYIAGIPLDIAIKLSKENVHMIKDNIFWFKDKIEKKTYKMSIDEDGRVVEMIGVDGLGYKYIKDINMLDIKRRF